MLGETSGKTKKEMEDNINIVFLEYNCEEQRGMELAEDGSS
jgi:hypothetical protein